MPFTIATVRRSSLEHFHFGLVFAHLLGLFKDLLHTFLGFKNFKEEALL